VPETRSDPFVPGLGRVLLRCGEVPQAEWRRGAVTKVGDPEVRLRKSPDTFRSLIRCNTRNAQFVSASELLRNCPDDAYTLPKSPDGANRSQLGRSPITLLANNPTAYCTSGKYKTQPYPRCQWDPGLLQLERRTESCLPQYPHSPWSPLLQCRFCLR
jgi:hypothetical protein